jgi:hypothetical protein
VRLDSRTSMPACITRFSSLKFEISNLGFQVPLLPSEAFGLGRPFPIVREFVR